MSKRIVIADDTAYMRLMLKEAITAMGHQVVAEAEDGEAALACYRQQQPDLMIMNIVMPKMGGLDALKQIKTWDPHAKVILCSAMGQAGILFAAIQAGATDFVAKPLDAKRLREAINKALNLQQLPQQQP